MTERNRHRPSSTSRRAAHETRDLPVFIAADGIHLTTEDGRTFLDFASGFESADTGAVREAVTEHLRSAHFHGDTEARFLDELQTILPAGLNHVHPTWFETYRARFERHPRVDHYRGVGAMYGVEVKTHGEQTDQELARDVRDATLQQGLLIWQCGVDTSVIGLIPPLASGHRRRG